MRTLIILMLLLAGCGQQGNDNHGLGFHFDASSSSGLRVRYAEGQNRIGLDGHDHLTIEEIDGNYRDVANCMGMELPTGPLLIFDPNQIENNSADNFELTYPDTGTIVVDSDLDFTPGIGIGHNAMRHGFVHHIFNMHGMRHESDNHASDLFITCAGI